ncbi:MAG: hypothetical protein JNL67_03425 [Planctomycetaceae bacterium]|nr:hypothetical protein [Planctomycetaceae bacterium]
MSARNSRNVIANIGKKRPGKQSHHRFVPRTLNLVKLAKKKLAANNIEKINRTLRPFAIWSSSSPTAAICRTTARRIAKMIDHPPKYLNEKVGFVFSERAPVSASNSRTRVSHAVKKSSAQ